MKAICLPSGDQLSFSSMAYRYPPVASRRSPVPSAPITHNEFEFGL